MANFELHVCRNGNWKRLETFEDRGTAMSAAIGIEHDRIHSGLKVIKEVFNEGSKTFETQLIHKWSERAEQGARNREVEQNLERQRQQRREIRQRAQSNEPSWRTRIMSYLVFTATAVTAIAGVVVLMVVLRGA